MFFRIFDVCNFIDNFIVVYIMLVVVFVYIEIESRIGIIGVLFGIVEKEEVMESFVF